MYAVSVGEGRGEREQATKELTEHATSSAWLRFNRPTNHRLTHSPWRCSPSVGVASFEEKLMRACSQSVSTPPKSSLRCVCVSVRGGTES